MRGTRFEDLWARLDERLDAGEQVVARGRAFEPVFEKLEDDLAQLVSGPGEAVVVTDRRLLWVGREGPEWVRSLPFAMVRSFTQVRQTHRYALILEHERTERARLSFVVPFARQGRMKTVVRKTDRSILAFSRRDTDVARALRAALHTSGAVEAPEIILPRPVPNAGSIALTKDVAKTTPGSAHPPPGRT